MLYHMQSLLLSYIMLIKSIRFWLSASNNNTHLSKLLTRTPKTVSNDLPEGLLARLFDQSKK